MKLIEVQLDDPTYERVQQLATSRAQTVGETAGRLVARSLELSEGEPTSHASLSQTGDVLGLFADDPAGVDDMMGAVMAMRKEQNQGWMERIAEFDAS